MPTLSPATARALELPSLLAVLAEFTTTGPGRDLVLALTPDLADDELDLRRRRYEEARVALVDAPLIGALDVDVPLLLERVADPRALLETADVLAAADLLRVVGRCATRLRMDDADRFPLLAELVADLPETRPFTRRVAQVLDPRGRVRDDASPKLGKLRNRVGKLRDRVYGELQGAVGRHAAHLSEETIPLHEGRLVLLLKSGARGQVDGLVHGRSGSGRSFYFEPLSAVESNNELRSAIDDEEAERARLVAELLEALRELAPALEEAARITAELDALQALSRFAERSAARLAELGDERELKLVGARHPLLDPELAPERERALGSPGHLEPVVPLDLELGGDGRLLVVTGPNAGGKTVALKTLGLLAAATACGVPVPCERGTRLPRLDHLVATVGDEQDLLHDRSTFSARLLRLAEAWEAAGERTLVLLDELGSGTDPDEGAALAIALLAHLHESGSLTLVTTHLTRVAAMALETEGARCAAMEFDAQRGVPTFRLRPGRPGASEALALATRLRLPQRWIREAERLVDPERRRLQAVLDEVERERQALEQEREEVREALDAAEATRAEADAERAALESERRSLARRLKARFAAFEEEVRGRLTAAEASLREELAAGSRKGAGARRAAELLDEAPLELIEGERPATVPIEVGGRVRHRGLGWEGTLVRLSRGKAEVSVRGKTMRCGENDLEGLAADDDSAGKPARRPATPKPSTSAAGTAEIDLIGRRVDAGLDELDRQLDRALLAGHDTVRVIHGHGTGQLRKAVRKHLVEHPAVHSHRPGGEEEGGDGATIVTLAG